MIFPNVKAIQLVMSCLQCTHSFYFFFCERGAGVPRRMLFYCCRYSRRLFPRNRQVYVSEECKQFKTVTCSAAFSETNDVLRVR